MAIAVDPGYADGYRMLGNAYKRDGDPVWAREAYEQGMRAAPDNFVLAWALGDLELALGRYEAAENAYRCALVLRPDDSDLLYNVAQTVGLQGRTEETTRLLERARELSMCWLVRASGLFLLRRSSQ